jgi:CRP/FNR family transcriptional regulator
MGDLAFRLSRAEVFNKLPEAEWAELARRARRRYLQTGEFVCHQGDIWPNVIFLASGRLWWTILSAGGQEYVPFAIEPGAVVWGHSVFDDQPMPACVMAAKASDVCQWSREVILPILYRNPSAIWEITRIQVRAMRRAREIIYGLAFQPVAGRLAKLLLQRFAGQEDIPVERDLTLSEIAAMIASSPEVVCRLLHQFQEDGLLEITRAHITLHDREALEKLVRMA